MASNTSCPFPFLDAALFPPDFGYVAGRLCSTVPLPGQLAGTVCCLPCPVQDYTLHPSSLRVLFANDVVNMVGVGVGAFVLLVWARWMLLIAVDDLSADEGDISKFAWHRHFCRSLFDKRMTIMG
jgi:hypothetical protein